MSKLDLRLLLDRSLSQTIANSNTAAANTNVPAPPRPRDAKPKPAPPVRPHRALRPRRRS
jgi:hypothetical protein